MVYSNDRDGSGFIPVATVEEGMATPLLSAEADGQRQDNNGKYKFIFR